MNTTATQRKQKAIQLMKELKIYQPYIDGFVKDNNVCYYENYAGFWAWQDKELTDKIREIETRNNCTVYAVTHEFTSFGECYDFLIVTDYPDEWEHLLTQCDGNYYACAYVWNKDDEWCSEFGDIAITSFGGGIKRVG